MLDVDRINDCQTVAGHNLDQTKLWTIAVFGNKFRVETEDLAVSDFIAELVQFIDRIYGLVLQRYARYLTFKSFLEYKTLAMHWRVGYP